MDKSTTTIELGDQAFMRCIILSVTIVLLSACASMPPGPSVLVLPGSTKSFETFRADDYACQQYALVQIGGVTPNQAANSSGVASAAIGTALGAAAGAAFGGGQGAAVGAGTGLIAGSLVGTGEAGSYGYETQNRYDVAYIQCMYAKGHRVPVSGQFSNEVINTPTNLPSNIPPPPPGLPPPPPLK